MIYLGRNPIGLADRIADVATLMRSLEIYVADYYSDPPTVTYGVMDRLNRTITVEIVIVE